MTRIVVIVQARMGSTRLPGKVLLPAGNAPLLARMLERVTAAEMPTEVVVATTPAVEDEPIRALCRALGIHCLAGHPTDLLDRHLTVARAVRADVVVKVPSDCPLIDPAVIDRVIGRWIVDRADYVSNLHPASYPDGNDVEVVPLPILELAWREARRPLEREHTTPFVWDQPERFRLANVLWDRDLSATHRLTLDYREDYALIRAVFDELWSPDRIFGLDEIVELLEARPALRALNAMHLGASWMRLHPGELKTLGGVR